MVFHIGTHIDCGECLSPNVYASFLLRSLPMLKRKGCDYMQTFSGDKISTSLKQKFPLTVEEKKRIKSYLVKEKMQLVFHSILSINVASPFQRPYAWNTDNLWYDLQTLHSIGRPGSFIVVHMGSMKSKRFVLNKTQAIQHWIVNTKYLLQKMKKHKMTYPRILFETPSTFTNKIGATWEDLHTFWKAFTPQEKKQLGFCLDTAHLFVLGVPVHTVEGIHSFLSNIPKGRVKEMIGAIHLNDSTHPLGSFHDVHAPIGTGHIFSSSLGGSLEALKEWVHFADQYSIPCILETRNVQLPRELKLIRSMISKTKQKGGKKKHDWKERILTIFQDLEQFHTLLPAANRNKATPYRIRGYQQAIQHIQQNEHPIYTVQDIDTWYQDIGSKTMEKMKEIVRSKGHLAMHDDILKTPWFAARKEFSTIKGFGPVCIDSLLKKGIWSISDLKQAVHLGTVKLNDMQTLGLEYHGRIDEHIPRKRIKTIGTLIGRQTGMKVYLAGSYRTGKDYSGDIDMILTTPMWKTMEDVVKDVEEVLGKITGIVAYFAKGVHYISCIYRYKHTYQQLDLRCVPYPFVETYLLYFGSGVVFSRLLRQHAKKMGYTLTEWGLFDIRTKQRLNIYSEKEIMHKLGVKYVAPERRRMIQTLPLL